MPERAQLLEAVASMDDEQLKPEKADFEDLGFQGLGFN